MAQAEIDVIGRTRWQREARSGATPPFLQVDTLQSALFDRFRKYIWLVVASTACVLLMACVNLAILFVARDRANERMASVRMALGAEKGTILGMVLRQGTALAFLGVGIGLLAALAVGRVIATMLFEISPGDPPTFSLVPILLVAVAGLACYVPARRATRVDPMVALRCE